MRLTCGNCYLTPSVGLLLILSLILNFIINYSPGLMIVLCRRNIVTIKFDEKVAKLSFVVVCVLRYTLHITL